MKIQHFFLFFILIFTSCEQDVSVDLPHFEEKLVVESYIVEGDSVFIVRIDKTVNPILKGNVFNYDTNFAGTYVVLSYNNNSYTLRSISDYMEKRRYNVDVGNNIPGRFFVLDKKVENVSSIKLVAKYRTLHVESECKMPPSVHITEAKLTGISDDSIRYSKFKIDIEANFPSVLSYYMVRILGKYPDSHLIGYDDGIREIARDYYIVNSPVQKKEFILNNTSARIGEFNIYMILLSHIEKTYYDFALASNSQFGELADIIPTETTEVPSNIRGGYGIFTAMSSDTAKVTLQ